MGEITGVTDPTIASMAGVVLHLAVTDLKAGDGVVAGAVMAKTMVALHQITGRPPLNRLLVPMAARQHMLPVPMGRHLLNRLQCLRLSTIG